MTSISGGRVDLGTLVPADVRTEAPALVSNIEQDAALHEALARDAHAELGAPGSRPGSPWAADRRRMDLWEALSGPEGPTDEGIRALERNRHAVPVRLGTQVAMPGAPLGEAAWTVVGAGRSDRLELARRNHDGTIQRQARRWPELVVANPSLVDEHLFPGPDGSPRAIVPARPPFDAPPQVLLEHEAMLLRTPAGQHPYEVVSPGALDPIAVGTWDELARGHGLTRLRGIPTVPSDAQGATGLVATARDPKRYVFAAESQLLLGHELLVGADGLPASHRAASDLRRLEDVGDFFHRLGLRTWADVGDDLLLTTGSPESLGNAAAHGNADYAMVITGPRDARVASLLTDPMPYGQRTAVRATEDVLRAYWKAVLAHEVGHVATQQAWTLDVSFAQGAAQEAGDHARFAALAEHKVVEEAFSDLFGASYSRSRDIGVRDLGRLHNGIGDLDQLRATITKLGFQHSGHTGTQLVTKPMLELQRRHGWDAVAEVTASATHRLGAAIGRGDIDAIGVEDAARALRDAAAMRFGLEDDGVRAMASAWSKLRVIL